MAEEKKQEEKEIVKTKPKREEKPRRPDEGKEIAMAKSLVRIMGTDIPGDKNVCFGLTRIKGISFSIASAICHVLKIDKHREISSLSPEEIKKITDFALNPKIPSFLLNRRKDMETGEDKHAITTSLDLQKEFDIRRLKKIRSYRGWRHAKGLPVRGQRTKAHFRTGRAIGVVKAKMRPGSEAAAKEGKEKRKKNENK